MSDEEILSLFEMQSENVQKLVKVKKNLIKDINFYVKKNDEPQIEIKTKLLGLVFSTFSEAQFIQILHTPNGLNYSEIQEVKRIRKRRDIIKAWYKMIDFALSKVADWRTNSDIKNRKEKLENIIKEYIQPQSIIRNKLAHGQWVIALNSEKTGKNCKLTTSLKNLDYVEISKWFEVQKYFGRIMRDLIQSPLKGFHNNYWNYISELQVYLNKTKSWNFESKKAKLLKRKRFRKDDND